MKRSKSVHIPRLNMMRLKIYVRDNMNDDFAPALQRNKKVKAAEPTISIADALK